MPTRRYDAQINDLREWLKKNPNDRGAYKVGLRLRMLEKWARIETDEGQPRNLSEFFKSPRFSEGFREHIRIDEALPPFTFRHWFEWKQLGEQTAQATMRRRFQFNPVLHGWRWIE